MQLGLTMPSWRIPSIERRHWAGAMLVGVVSANLFAGVALLGHDTRAVAKATIEMPATVRANPAAPPAPEPLQFQSVAPQDAVSINAAVPIVDGPNPAAKPFKLNARTDADRTRALDCLTSAIYYEAATEPAEGQRAVAQVVLNRVRHPAYPNSVCGVVYQGAERSTGCQFTFSCDGSLKRLPLRSYWERARKIAEDALAGKVYAPVGLATHYHTNWVVPYWSSSLAKLANVGTHIFYRWSGGWGKPPAFAQGYARSEPVIDLAALRSRTPAPTEDTVDVAAADAAAKAAIEAAAGDAGSVDSFQRAVLRRYEPIEKPKLATLLADQATKMEPTDKDAVSHRWALAGDGLGTSGAPLGKPAEAKKVEPVKPLAPACLSGVRKVGEAASASCASGG